jgi:lysozyme family protein
MDTLQKGSRGPDVAQLQRRLEEEGLSPGAIDGIFGAATEAAILAFQKSHGLAVDGVVGPQTAAALELVIVGTGLPRSGRMQVKDVRYIHYRGGGDIASWIAEACRVVGLPHTEAWAHGYETLCKRESSYQPNAINTYDSNATGPIVADGYPLNCSRGVAQCIPPTFAAYHVAGTSPSIYDPVANIAASMQYVRHRYHVSPDGSDLAAKVQQADPQRPPRGY